ncbi:MAG: hypothetical protein LBI37_01905, partial [Puniceicoccales bacterium]|nr:hypothetical protein [Puniceicoccales bacterium]
KPIDPKINTLDANNLFNRELQEFYWDFPPASPRREGWVFDLFTPPQILFSNGTFSASLPSQHQEDSDLSIISISKRKYKVQFSGYFQKPDGVNDVNKFTLMLYDIEKNHNFWCQVGDNLQEQNIKIVGFEEKSSLENSPLKNEPLITIYDNELAETIQLSRHAKFYDDKYIIVIMVNSISNTFVLTEINNSFLVKKTTYSLDEVNIKEGYIQLTKTNPNGSTSTLTLTIKNLPEKTLHDDLPKQSMVKAADNN